MVDYDFFKNQAEMLNLNSVFDSYYIGKVKFETEIMRYNETNKSVTVWPNLYYSELMKEIRTGEELSWKEESIKYLEGGKEAFEERGDLYA